jgi:hypothetical protein
MKLSAGMNKWAIVILGVACVFLVANLVTQYRGMQPGHLKYKYGNTLAYRPRTEKTSDHATDDLARYDPNVHFDTLRALDSRGVPDEKRNPFEFVGEPAPVVAKAAPAPPPLPPPPPPPPPVKAVGYNELPGGQKEAMVTYNGDMNVVHEGDMVGTKYKIVSITTAVVTVEDTATHEKLELPIPQ